MEKFLSQPGLSKRNRKILRDRINDTKTQGKAETIVSSSKKYKISKTRLQQIIVELKKQYKNFVG